MIWLSRTFVIFILVTTGGMVGGLSQAPEPDLSKYSAPVAWTTYGVRDQKLSFRMPKLPVASQSDDLCANSEGHLYYAYAAGVVYEFEWYRKSDKPIPDSCNSKKKFSEETFKEHVAELKKQSWGYKESEGSVAGLKAVVLRSTPAPAGMFKSRWLMWDKDRWLELGITRRADTQLDEDIYLSGLKRDSPAGAEVGAGSDRMLGDADVDQNSDHPSELATGLAIVTKPRPGYTELARSTNVQGTVLLRAVFLKNGGIGEISVIKALPAGLTERAIAALKRVAFLPAIVAGKPVTVTKQVEYSFSIY
jgi:TonB family protein